jgi:hypothetical protein
MQAAVLKDYVIWGEKILQHKQILQIFLIELAENLH